jgi:peptidoglycan/xylan/chitin deacetylase (PgdA/CDA1 family)
VKFFRTPALLPWLYPNLVWRLPVSQPVIYLTFDDGPIPGPTEFVLECLRSARARATFFCIGDNAQRHPTILHQIVQEGHQLGNHTFHHLNGWRTARQVYTENITACQRVLEAAQPTTLFRPPYGRITRSQIREVWHAIIMWDVLTHDYNRHLSAAQCLRQSIRATRPGSIVVFHDSLKAEKNLRYVLPRYLQHFATLGYQFHALPPRL